MRKIWNRPAYPVWSLATNDGAGDGNFNICTYVTPMSLQPKMMMIALYHHTKTLENVRKTETAVLQLLTESQADIVRTCGRQSGRAVDKIARVSKKHEIKTVGDFPYLADCAGYMELSFVDFEEVGADHVLGVAKVTRSKNLSEEAILTTDYLKEHDIIR